MARTNQIETSIYMGIKGYGMIVKYGVIGNEIVNIVVYEHDDGPIGKWNIDDVSDFNIGGEDRLIAFYEDHDDIVLEHGHYRDSNGDVNYNRTTYPRGMSVIQLTGFEDDDEFQNGVFNNISRQLMALAKVFGYYNYTTEHMLDYDPNLSKDHDQYYEIVYYADCLDQEEFVFSDISDESHAHHMTVSIDGTFVRGPGDDEYATKISNLMGITERL